MSTPHYSPEADMRTQAHAGIVVLAALMLGLGAPAAAQFTITYNAGSARAATHYGQGSFIQPQTVQTTFGPNGGAAVAHIDVGPFGRLRGVQTGYGLNAVAVDAQLQDVPSFDWHAGTTYDVTVENTGSVLSSPLDFQYHINGGRLELFDPSLGFGRLFSSVSASIYTISPGFSGFLWAWTISLRGDFFGNVSSSVDFFIDPLGLGMPALSPITIANGRAGLTIGAFTAGANLGRLSPGGTASVSYDMDAFVGGPGFGGGGLAMLGDPFDVNGDYGNTFTIAASPTVAPEPETVWLLASGLVAFGALRSRYTFNRRSGSWH